MTDRFNLLCVLKILEEYSDANHILTTRDIIEKLDTLYDKKTDKKNARPTDRRTVYACIEALCEFGYPVSKYEDNGVGYYLEERIFSDAELKLLIDAVFSCEYISKKQTEELLEKLRGLVSCNDRKKYNYTNIVATDKKSSNQEIFLNIEDIENAINNNKKISFTYMDYDYDKSLKPKHRELYIANPYKMVCDSSKYYLAATTNRHPEIGYYRIDMMKNLKILEDYIDVSRKDAKLDSVKKIVYAFAGKPVSIHLHCDKGALRYVIERFGKDTVIKKNKDGSFEAFFSAAPQGVIYWALGYLSTVEVVSPPDVRNEVIRIIRGNKYEA